jgi:ethanolamine utilization microcompartment shell protein EutS
MASSYTPSLRLELMGTGDQVGTWGATANSNFGTLLETAVAGYTSVSVTSANQALTANNGAADEARNAMLALTTTTGANFAVYAPPAEKTYIIYNASAYTATIYNSTVLGNTTAAGTGVAIPAGKATLVWSDGTNCAAAITHLPGAVTTGAGLTVASGLTVTAGGLLVTAGGLTVTAGNTVLTAGDLTLTSGDVVMTSGDLTLTDGDLVVNGSARTVPEAVAFSATPTFDAATSNVFTLGAMTANITDVTINNPTDGQSILIRLVQDGTGGRTVTLPSTIKAAGAVDTGANRATLLAITYFSTSSKWEGGYMVVPA